MLNSLNWLNASILMWFVLALFQATIFRVWQFFLLVTKTHTHTHTHTHTPYKKKTILKYSCKIIALVCCQIFNILTVLSISTNGWRKASAILIREVGYFSTKFKPLVDTVGYFTQTSRLCQILLKPLYWGFLFGKNFIKQILTLKALFPHSFLCYCKRQIDQIFL